MTKKSTHLDRLGESHIPSDLLTAPVGSTYGMDTLEDDLQFGMGDIGLTIGDEHSELPIGLNTEAAESLDLTDFLKEADGLSDLEWLDPSQLQDPDRLPHTPESIPELEEAWSQNKPYGNVFASHSTDLTEVRYREAVESDEAPQYRLDKKALQGVIASVMRRSAAGLDIDTAIKTALESCGEEMGRIAPALRAVRAEHGLAGNVFIRASAYPNYGSGKWKELIRKSASGARYLIVSKAELEGSTWVKDGHCQITGKRAVLSVPWKQAYDYYAPRLTGTGRKVAAPKNYAAALRQAFLSHPDKVAVETDFPVHITPSERISASAAREALANHVPVREVSDPTAARLAREMPQVKTRLAQMVSARLLTAAQSQEILASKLEPFEMLRKAGSLATRSTKKGGFNGSPNEARFATADAAVARTAAYASREQLAARGLAAKEEQAALDARIAAALDRVKKLVASGLRGKVLVAAMKRTISAVDLQAALPQIKPHLSKTGALVEVSTPEYQGSQFRQAEEHVASVGPVEGKESVVAKWARRTMSEGFAGNELTAMIESRFTTAAIEEAYDALKQARDLHEGGAGFLYVDASAYATPTGVKGCESGALKHATNLIPAVAAMSRCGSCTLATQLDDGTRRCSLYNKTLISARDITSKEVVRTKQANIHTADNPDYDNTAAMFAPVYDPDEFGLQEQTLEGIDLSETERLGQILFGSWDIS